MDVKAYLRVRGTGGRPWRAPWRAPPAPPSPPAECPAAGARGRDRVGDHVDGCE